MNNNSIKNASYKNYLSLLHCRSKDHNVYNSTVETPEQGAEYFQN